jgi:hypothetical protein
VRVAVVEGVQELCNLVHQAQMITGRGTARQQMIAEGDPRLQRVVTAWPELPKAVRRAILALVDTTRR